MAAVGRELGGPRAQIWFAACFALLPRVTAMGIEARPYAISAMFMAFSVLIVIKLRSKNTPWLWPALWISLTGTVGAHLFSAIPVTGLIAIALVVVPGWRRMVVLLTAAAAGLTCLPLAIWAAPQQTQVSWLAEAGYSLTDQALVEAWFTSRWNINPDGIDIPLHAIAVALSLVALLTVVAAFATGRGIGRVRMGLAVIPLALTLGVLWGASVLHEPIMLGRYLTSSTPFFAILLAEGLLMLSARPRQVLAGLLVAGCTVLIVAQRQPYSKIPSNDYGFIASALRETAQAGDGLLIEPGLGPVDAASNAKALYPEDFSRLQDIVQPQRPPLTHVFAADPRATDITSRQLPPRVWLVTKVGQKSGYTSQLLGKGLHVAHSRSGPAHTVTLWVGP